MGRRATSSTKGGRFMNPADQQRKVERRKELKRNKKQRVQVRAAVLKGKDAEDILEQMTRLDQMIFDPHNPPPLAERVIQEKHEKLKSTYIRVLCMHKKEDEPEKAEAMQKELREYEQQRKQMQQNFMAVKFANEADPNDIPLPDGLSAPGAAMTPAVPIGPAHTHTGNLPSHMLLPDSAPPLPHSILKRHSSSRGRSDVPPGPPAGLPPQFSDSEDEEDDDDITLDTSERVTSKVRFADGVDEDDKDTRTKYKLGAKAAKSDEDQTSEASRRELGADVHAVPHAAVTGPPPRNLMHPPPPMGMPGPGFMPPRMNTMYPPPGAMHANANRAPLGPRPPMGHPSLVPAPTSAAVISAAPTVLKPAPGAEGSAVIQAKPQMRNLRHEITKMVPTAVKIRREGQVKMKPRSGTAAASGFAPSSTSAGYKSSVSGQATQQLGQTKPTTDDAYSQFMKEMGLI